VGEQETGRTFVIIPKSTPPKKLTPLLQSFILLTLPYNILLPPLLLAILRPLSFGALNYLPAGPTPLLFAILAQYHAAIPPQYTYSIGTGSPPTNPPPSLIPSSSALFTSKSTSYLLPIQLALSQFPSSILPAVVGWVVGYAYRRDLLPGAAWRVPRWVWGPGRGRRDGDARRLAALMRTMQREEEATVVATGVGSSASAVRRGVRGE
jgi:hypothetical protein